MSNLKIKIDVESISSQFAGMQKELENDLKKGVGNLAAVTHARVIEMANNELKSTRKKFLDSLGFEEISGGIWVVSVDENGLFVEDGIPNNTDMKPGLLKKAPKISKSGYRYRSIPFDYGKPPSQNTGATQMMVDKIRSELRKEGVPFKGIERDSKGSPRVGKLHSFDFKSNIPGKGNTPQLHGVSIYQTKMNSGKIRRDILTFRTVSEGPNSSGKFIHPGLEAKKFLDRALTWAENTWSEQILPEILSKYSGK